MFSVAKPLTMGLSFSSFCREMLFGDVYVPCV